MNDFEQALSEFAEQKRPSNPEIARVLRDVRKIRTARQPRRWLWFFAFGGWVAAAFCLALLAKQPREPQVIIQSDPDLTPRRIPAPERAPAALPLPEAPAEPAPPAEIPHLETPRPLAPPPRLLPRPLTPAPSAAPAPEPATSAALPTTPALPAASAMPASSASPRLPSEQSLLLARGHLHRIEGVLEVIRESGTGSRVAAEQRCFAEQYRALLGIEGAAREQLARIEGVAHGGDVLQLDLELERLVSLRRSADGIYNEARRCIGVRLAAGQAPTRLSLRGRGVLVLGRACGRGLCSKILDRAAARARRHGRGLAGEAPDAGCPRRHQGALGRAR